MRSEPLAQLQQKMNPERYTAAPLSRFVSARRAETLARECFTNCYTTATVSHMEAGRPADGSTNTEGSAGETPQPQTTMEVWLEFLGLTGQEPPHWTGGAGAGEPAYRFDWNPPTSDGHRAPWLLVSGGNLDQPLRIRVGRGTDHRFLVTGLVVGEDGGGEITSDTLRRIRLGEIMRALFTHFEPGERLDPDDVLRYQMLRELVADRAAPVATTSRSPQDDQYRAFAQTYLRELARQPRRAMTAAASAHQVSRATANRWAAVCRERGYLPRTTEAPKGQPDE